MFKKVLVSNRGEIAIRIIRALREMEINSVAVYSEADKQSLHRFYADEAYLLQGSKAVDTYLHIEKIVKIAKEARVDAVHPGYGFLSENEDFVRALEENDIAFIGPRSKTIELMGNKIAAKKLLSTARVPLIPGSLEEVKGVEEAEKVSRRIGYPVMIKAAAGGGGIGMKIVNSPEQLPDIFHTVCKQAASVFGNASVYIEKYIEHARHIEFQVMGDRFGNYVHLGDRECSIQRRHQKIIEESPSPAISDKIRKKMGNIAVTIARAADYESAGTVEFLYSEGEFYFIEMNTRLQVEHPVTEMLTGIDIVKTQISLAEGASLPFRQEDIHFRGHAIECRICAEDPMNGFLPSPGIISAYHSPGGFGVRVDAGVCLHSEVTHYYDSMISKLVVWEENRKKAISKMNQALREYVISGIKTNIPYLEAVMRCSTFQNGEYNTKYIHEHTHLFEHCKAIHENKLEKCNVSRRINQRD